MFYTSLNLTEWKLASTFGELDGAHGGVWECPDLFPVPVNGNPEEVLWVLLVSVGSGAPAGGSGSQYFVGSFDGKVFTNHDLASKVNWMDYGKDNYAGVTFSGLDDRRILMGWMSNWYYAYQIPTSPWKGAMTLPRELSLVAQEGDNLKLASNPVPELHVLRGEHFSISEFNLVSGEKFSVLKSLDGAPVEIDVEITKITAEKIIIELISKEHDRVILGYDLGAGKLYLDRCKAGLVDFEPSFGRQVHSVLLALNNSKLNLRVFLDTSSIEVFADDGFVVLTDLIFPRSGIEDVSIYTLNGEAIINHLDAWVLSRIWD